MVSGGLKKLINYSARRCQIIANLIYIVLTSRLVNTKYCILDINDDAGICVS